MSGQLTGSLIMTLPKEEEERELEEQVMGIALCLYITSYSLEEDERQ